MVYETAPRAPPDPPLRQSDRSFYDPATDTIDQVERECAKAVDLVRVGSATEKEADLRASPQSARATIENSPACRRLWAPSADARPPSSARCAVPPRKPKRVDPSSIGRAAGVSTEDADQRVVGVRVGKLTGENFRDSGEPSYDTRTQRAWLYNCDPSLANIEYGGNRPQVAKTDNELSIPIGDGAMKKVRDDLKGRRGMLYRTATLITKGAGQRPGVAIFQDD